MSTQRMCLPGSAIKPPVFRLKNQDIHRLLTNSEVFPIEVTLTSGDKLKIPHPDYVFSRKRGQIFYYPEGGGGLFEWIEPRQVAKIRGKIKRGSLRAA